jgi:threonylcarbamoyladenosine tRNA methylthiotransferase MtaB
LKKPGRNNPGRVAVYTLGCKVNQFESDCLQDRFRDQGFEIVPFKQEADLYIINTCAVTHEAQRQSAQMVRQVIRNHPESLVVAAGCAAQLFPEDYEKISELDYIVGTFKKLKIPFRISSLEKTASPRNLLAPEAAHTIEAQFPKPAQRTRAFVRIQEGCNANCSYCLVPRARGRSRSLPVQDVLSGVETLANQGIKELILTGIHLGQYGSDHFPVTDLVFLMDLLLQTHPHLFFRLSSLEPQEVTPALLGLFKKYPNLCPHLHIPLQAGEDSLLRKMNRTYSTDFYGRLIRTIRREIPHAALGADLIVGFPGEEDLLFQKTVDFISTFSPSPPVPAPRRPIFLIKSRKKLKKTGCKLSGPWTAGREKLLWTAVWDMFFRPWSCSRAVKRAGSGP